MNTGHLTLFILVHDIPPWRGGAAHGCRNWKLTSVAGFGRHLDGD